MEIESHLFPIPDSVYSHSGFLDPYFPVSIIAFNLQMVSAPGNLLHDQRGKGFFFFRNTSVPLPRPCTFLAWERLCRLGNLKSQTFLIPFLPALREDDEIGSAIGERNIRLPSLSRKSSLHIKNEEGRIQWGSVYLASLSGARSDSDSPLVGAIERSNIHESLVLPRSDQHYKTAQDSIRNRLEFLASHGILSLDSCDQLAGIPHCRRLLFQFLNQEAADQWARAYVRCSRLIQSDPQQVNADWKDFVQELILAKRSEKIEGIVKETKLRAKDRFGGDLSIIF